MASLVRWPKTRIFWKSARGDQGKFFKNRPKSSPRLKGPKELWRKRHYPLISMHLNGKDWRRLWFQKVVPKLPEWPSYCNFGKVTQNPHFLKKCKWGTKGNFSKISQKVAFVWKAKKPFWRKWHYPLVSMLLKCKDWKRFWSKRVAPKVPELPRYGIFRKVTQNPHFLKNC